MSAPRKIGCAGFMALVLFTIAALAILGTIGGDLG